MISNRPSALNLVLSLAGLCSAAGVACGDPLVDPALIDGPRVLGARVSTPSLESGSAEPGAGEPARIDWLVASNVAGSIDVTLAFCVAEPKLLGPSRCAGEPFAELASSGSLGEPLTAEFELPPELAAGDDWLAWLGHCEEGAARFDVARNGFACPGGEAPLSAFYRGRVPSGEPNHNPDLSDDVLRLDGAEWVPTTPNDAEPCRGGALPVLVPGVASRLEFSLGGDDREPLELETGRYGARERESLVYTHVASRAGLERAFSAIDHDAAGSSFELSFEIDAGVEIAPAGEPVSFYLLVRDERGGVDFSRRSACLLPEQSSGEPLEN